MRGTRLILAITLAAGLLPAAHPNTGPQAFEDPHGIDRWDPRIPERMRYDGHIWLEYRVSETGAVSDIKPLYSSSPNVEETAVGALLRWHLQPALRHGKPVAVRIQRLFTLDVWRSLHMTFTESNYHSGPTPWGIPFRAAADAPPDFQYDTRPYPMLTLPVVYPRDLLVKRIKGEATIAFEVDTRGHPRNVVVTEASDPAFGPPTVAMMRTWRYSRPLKKGVPCRAKLVMTQTFRLDDEVVESDDETSRIVKALRADPCPIVASPAALDAPPKPLYTPKPFAPETTAKAAGPLHAEIEIVVDRKGHAQAAKILSATREDYGWAAAAAAGRWQFTIPMKGGEPVDVFVRIPFESRPDDTGDRDRMGLTIGLDSMDPKWRDFRPYLIGFARKVEMYWRAVLAKYPQARTGVGVVGIRLIVNSRGELGGVVHMETPPIDGARAGMLGCGDAVKASAPFAKWTPEMTAALGNEQDLMLYFTL